MHALTKFILDRMAAEGLTQADLARRSGLTPQNVSNLVNDKRDSLVQRPDQKTIEGLAKVLTQGDTDVLLAKVGEAMGIPVGRTVTVYDASQVSNAELISELARRLDKGTNVRPLSAPSSTKASIDARSAASRRREGGRDKGDDGHA